MRKLQYAAISLASILSLTFLGSCSKDTEYIDRIITETDTLYIQKIDTVSPPTDTALCVGQGVIEPTGGKVPLTIMVYSTGGRNLDYSTNMCFLTGLRYFANDGSKSVVLGEDVNVVVQHKFSSAKNLYTSHQYNGKDYITKETAKALGGNTYRSVFNTKGIEEYKSWIEKNSTTAIYNAIYKYSDLVGDSTYAINSAESLTDFIDYSTTVAPAEKYILVIDDHGSGYHFDNNITRAVLQDDNRGGTTMSMPQIYNGIKDSDIKKVSAIIFNTCLENNLEDLCELVGAADYAVAQSHLSIASYNWIPFLSYYYKAQDGDDTDEGFESALDLFAKAAFSEVEQSTITSGIGKIVDSTNIVVDFYAHDICVTRLDKLEDVGAAISDFSKFLIDKQKEEDSLGVKTLADNVINKCYCYETGSNLYDVVDLVSLAYDNYPDEMEEIWNNFEDAVKNAIVACYNNSETWDAKSSALTNKGYNYDTSWSIYLNSKQKMFNPKENVSYTEDELDETYGTLKFREYTTDEDNTYSWYTWLLSNNVTPTGNPTAYPTRDAFLKFYSALAANALQQRNSEE